MVTKVGPLIKYCSATVVDFAYGIYTAIWNIHEGIVPKEFLFG
jgi:hypothetical protein